MSNNGSSSNSFSFEEDLELKQDEEDRKQQELLNEKLKLQRIQHEKLIPILKKQWNATLIDVSN